MPEISPNPSHLVNRIPAELQLHLAAYLDAQSGKNVAETCKSLREVGERALYRSVDLTSGWSAAEIDSDRFDDYSATMIRATRVIAKTDNFLAALQAHPVRQRYVRTLRLEPYDGFNGATGDKMMVILSLIAPHLEGLAILPLPYYGGRRPGVPARDTYHVCFYHQLNADQTPYPKLTHVRYALPCYSSKPNRDVHSWLGRLDSLRELDLGVYDCNHQPVFPSSDFRKLQRLTVTGVNDHTYGAEVLASIVSLASSLQYLHVDGNWDQHEPASKAVSGLTGLKTLAVAWMDRYGPIHSDQMGLVTSSPERGIEQIATPLLKYTPAKVMRNFIGLYRMEDLKRVTFIDKPCPGHVPEPVHSTPLPPVGILPRFIRNIRTTPLLTTTLFLGIETPFPSVYHPDFTPPDLFVPPHLWETGGHRGFILRHYRAQSITGDAEFWHMRALLLDEGDATGGVAAGRRWQISTHFQGATVPWDVLVEVYQAIGAEVDFMEGGRDFRMGDAGWAVLRKWRASAVEDDVSDGED